MYHLANAFADEALRDVVCREVHKRMNNSRKKEGEDDEEEYGRGYRLSNIMAATERVLPERACSQKEGLQRIRGDTKCAIL